MVYGVTGYMHYIVRSTPQTISGTKVCILVGTESLLRNWHLEKIWESSGWDEKTGIEAVMVRGFGTLRTGEQRVGVSPLLNNMWSDRTP